MHKITLSIDPLHPHALVGITDKGVELAAIIKMRFNVAVLAMGGERKTGQAPRGQMERLMEARLRKLQNR